MTTTVSIDTRLQPIAAEIVEGGIPLDQATQQFELKLISVALRMARGYVSDAAIQLGVHRNTLHNKVRGNAQIAALIRDIRRDRIAGRGERA